MAEAADRGDGQAQVEHGEILAVPAVLTAHSVFAIRTVLSRGPVPLTHWR